MKSDFYGVSAFFYYSRGIQVVKTVKVFSGQKPFPVYIHVAKRIQPVEFKTQKFAIKHIFGYIELREKSTVLFRILFCGVFIKAVIWILDDVVFD